MAILLPGDTIETRSWTMFGGSCSCVPEKQNTFHTKLSPVVWVSVSSYKPNENVNILLIRQLMKAGVLHVSMTTSHLYNLKVSDVTCSK